MSQESSRRLIESLGCCPPGCFCTFKELFVRSPGNTRVLQQIKDLEVFKYHRGQREHRAIDWKEALALWKAEGHAAGLDHVEEPNGSVRELIEDLACCPKGHYCTLKEILVLFAPRNSRTLMQLKCLEIFKYERSKHVQREIDWNEALDLWVSEKHAVSFARLFHEGCRIAELYA
ncbi:MAG: hypothetical protein KJ726_09130, partial [Verrucomicrobia bacterium]|nr:hypothetical protein [Verrucomicrobiota bacterium]